MMKISKQVIVIVIGWILVATMLMCRVNGRRVDVGGKDTWKPGVNYTIWASQENLYVGDWLMFWFDKNYYDVLEVNQTSYESCNANGFITNITRGGRDVFELKEARPYYFICSKGYCYGGMKLAIHVTKAPPPSPPPEVNGASSLFYTGRINAMFLDLVMVILVVALLNKV